MKASLITGLLPILTVAIPSELSGLNFHTLEARQQNLPTIKLPYGTWQASKYDAVNDIYTFTNIRFAAPPVGNLRFAKPAPPIRNDTLQTGSYGGTCAQSIPKSLLGGLLPGGQNGAMAGVAAGLLSSVDMGKAMGGGPTSEDCLFLDLYVPGKALKGEVKLPVVNWIYGGAYILGAKDGIYNGTGIIKNAGGNVIFVAGNYRLGAFGFLAGTTAEKEGTPNAGFHDQRAVQQWIKDYAPLFGGNADDVSVWGESAGAGSIVHHLTAYGGKAPLLFKKAVILSPAYDALIDRRGDLEKNMQALLTAGGCTGKGLACLRALSFPQMKAAQEKFMEGLSPGKFGFGPAVDGTFVRQLPALEFASGNFAKGVESIIISHVREEAAMFVPNTNSNDTDFQNLQTLNFGVSAEKFSAVNEAMLKQFPSPNASPKYKTQRDRTIDYVQFSVFTCNARFVTEAYRNKTFNLQYSRGSGWHGMDILPTFHNAGSMTSGIPSLLGDKTFSSFASQYQSYLTSHARSGNVNKFRSEGTINWPHVEFGPTLRKVLNANDKGFELIDDMKTKAEDCDLWKDTFAYLTAAGGYAPPGAVVESKLFGMGSGNSSAHFK